MNVDSKWMLFSKTKSPEIKEELVINYLPYVKIVVDRIGYKKCHLFDYNDLFSYGVMGLLDAIDKYDYLKNVKFETYAYTRIKGSVIDALRKNSPLPRTVAGKVQAVSELLEANHNITEEEIKETLDITHDELLKVFDYMHLNGVISLDKNFTNTDEGSLYNTLPDTNTVNPLQQMENEETLEALQDAIELLEERDKLLIALYYKEKLTLKEIGKIIGVNESRVSQLHTRILTKLKTEFKSKGYIER